MKLQKKPIPIKRRKVLERDNLPIGVWPVNSKNPYKQTYMDYIARAHREINDCKCKVLCDKCYDWFAFKDGVIKALSDTNKQYTKQFQQIKRLLNTLWDKYGN